MQGVLKSFKVTLIIRDSIFFFCFLFPVMPPAIAPAPPNVKPPINAWPTPPLTTTESSANSS